MTSLIVQYGLPVVALIIFAGELGLPTIVPGEIGMLVVGNQDVPSVPILLLTIAILGAVDIVATSTIHIAARTGGNRLLRRLIAKIGSRRSPESIVQGFRRRLGGRDPVVVFVARLIPVFRLYASVATGLIRIDFAKFLLGAAPAAWLWASVPLTAGYVLRSQAGSIASRYSGMLGIAVPVSLAMTAAVVVAVWLHHRGTPAAAPS